MNTPPDITKKRPSITQAGTMKKPAIMPTSRMVTVHADYHAEEAAKHHAEEHGSK
jgi:hypothetical protein